MLIILWTYSLWQFLNNDTAEIILIISIPILIAIITIQVKLGKRKETRDERVEGETFDVRYPKPKILLIDCSAEISQKLNEIGFNTQTATFGSPYQISLDDAYHSIGTNSYFPDDFAESNIVVFDLSEKSALRGNITQNPPLNYTTPETPQYMMKGNTSFIDPQPISMLRVIERMDKILAMGGLFIIFLDYMPALKYYYGKYPGYNPSFLSVPRFPRFHGFNDFVKYNRLIFLSKLERFHLDQIEGEEVRIDHNGGNLSDFFQQWIIKYRGVKYTTKLVFPDNAPFRMIFVNKFGDPIGGILEYPDIKGKILLLPQLPKKADLLKELLRNELYSLSPHLFPFYEGEKWIEYPEYQFPTVTEYIRQKRLLEERKNTELQELDHKIEKEKEKFNFLYDLLKTHEYKLVKSIKETLKLLSFEDIIDVDDGSETNLQEDIQVSLDNIKILIEIKGIRGLPTEADSHQVLKYVNRRMKEWDSRNVHGVFLVNHQRNLPPLDRNTKIFTDQQITDAISSDMTLMTSWQLFLIVRGMMTNNWPRDTIKQIFLESGAFKGVPPHYEPVGIIVHYYTNISVISVKITSPSLSIGDTLGYFTKLEYLEEPLSSIQVDKEDRGIAKQGETVGIKTTFSKIQLRPKMIVYRVNSNKKATIKS